MQANSKRQSPSVKHQRGVTLLEVLVSLIILVLGVLGLAGLQARSLMMGQSSYYRSIAADLATDLSERIQANRSPFLADTNAEAKPALPPDFSTDSCTQSGGNFTCTTTGSQQTYLAANELKEWYSSLTTQLPGGSYSLTKESGASSNRYRYTLTISWTDDRSNSSNTSGSYSVVIE